MNIQTRRDTTDYILQVILWTALVGVLFFSMSACSTAKETLTPPQAMTLEALEQEKAAAEASGDPVAIATAEAKLDKFDEDVMRERAGPILGALAAVPGVGPISMVLAPLVLAGLPLLSKRGRSHLKNAVKGVATIGSSVAKAYGMKHTADTPTNG